MRRVFYGKITVTTPTQLPVPSEKPQDQKFNAGKIDEFVTSLVNIYIDRLGNKHYTIEGLRWLAQQAIAQYGWIPIGTFQAGATLTLPNQIIKDTTDGEYYRWDGDLPKVIPAGSTPESTGGVGAGFWISVGDSSLRSLLSSTDGTTAIGLAAGGNLSQAITYLTFEQFGAVGDGVVDDYAAMQECLDWAETNLPNGAVIYGNPSSRYRITNGIAITQPNTYIDLQKAKILYDNADGYAVTIGDGTSSALQRMMGIRNGGISSVYSYTTEVTSNNGVKFSSGLRRDPIWDCLHVEDFKGRGIRIEQLTWSSQRPLNSLIERCGTNLSLGENCNAVTISGLGVDSAINNNVEIFGCFGVTFVGGYNQSAGHDGIYIDNGDATSGQRSDSISILGVYFEANKSSNVHAKNGRSLTTHGCYMKCDNGTHANIRLESWAGAMIEGNSPTGLAVGGQRDNVFADSLCTLISVGQNFSTSGTDLQICKLPGASEAGLIKAINSDLASLPIANNLAKGSMLNLLRGGRAIPHILLTSGSSARTWREIALSKLKRPAGSPPADPLIPDLNQYSVYDLTIPTGGLVIGVPVGDVIDGSEITFILVQNSTGAGAITWNGIYKTSLSGSGTVSAVASVTFMYSAARTKWIQTAILAWS